MTASAATESLAVRRRRENRREEWREQERLVELLSTYLDPETTFFSSLENQPLSQLSGIFRRRRGIRAGLPDLLIICNGKAVFVELKSAAGVATRAQKQVRLELLAAGAVWYMARSARAALTALHLAGVVFRCPWTPPQLMVWEGPFMDPSQRLPQEPSVAVRRREARQRSRDRQRAREAAKLAAERDAATDGDFAA
jgi:hypothetical protein